MPSSVIGDLRINLLANFDQFSRDMQNAGSSLQNFGATATKIGAGLTAAITLPVVAFGQKVIRAGMDTQEAESLFETSFGDMSDSVRDWSNEMSKALGTNAFEMREQTATLFTMFRSMGIGAEEARKMSTELAVLTQDMASLRNLDPEVAFQKIQSGITGSTEPLMALGINLKQANVELVNLNETAFANVEATEEQEKVFRRFSSLMQQTSVDQGDLVRTQHSATNQLRRLGAQTEMLAAELGTALIPMVSQVLEVFLELIPILQAGVTWFTELSPKMQTVVAGGIALAAALGPVVVGIGLMASAIGAAMPVIAGVGTAIAAVATGPIGLIVAAIAGLTVVWVKLGDDIKRVTSEAFEVVRSWMVDRFGGIVESIRGKIDAVVGFFRDMKETLVGNSIIPDMVDAVEAEMEEMGESFENMVRRVEREQSRLNALYRTSGNLIVSEYVSARKQLIDSMVIEQGTTIELTDSVIALSEATVAADQFTLSFSDTLSNSFSAAVDSGISGLQSLTDNFFNMGNIVTSLMNSTFGPTGLLTNLMQQGMQKLGSLAWDGLKAIGGFFRSIFGGPSAKELAGREIVEQFQHNIASMLNETQLIEAGGELWKQVNIGVRDTYIELGLTEQQAMEDVQALYDAIKAGPDAVNPALQRIMDRMNGLDAEIQQTSDSLDELTRDRTISIDFDIESPDMPDIGAIGMQHGGFGRVTGPALFAVERGVTEDFAFSGANRRFGSMGGDNTVLETRLVAIERLLTRQPETIARSIRDAFVLMQRS